MEVLLSTTDETPSPEVTQLSNDELAQQVLDFERARAQLEAQQAEAINELRRRADAVPRRYRNQRLWFADQTHLPTRVAGRRFKRAELLHGTLALARPLLHSGAINSSHLDELSRLAERRELAVPLQRDLPLLLQWAQAEPWETFQTLISAWAEMVDPTDPADQDDRNLEARGLSWVQGLDNEIMVALDTTGLNWEQVLAAVEPIYERLLAEEWEVASSEHGDLATAQHLARTNRQRWHDAFFIVIRAGINQLTPTDTSYNVNVTVDLQTLEDEAQRQAGQTPVERDPEDARHYRCHTGHGLRLNATAALRAALAGTIRRMVLNTPSLDLEVSRSARLFRGPLREALVIRDQHCTGPGCQTPSHRCEADHVIPHHLGGPTISTNGKMRCGPCHRQKTRLEAEGIYLF